MRTHGYERGHGQDGFSRRGRGGFEGMRGAFGPFGPGGPGGPGGFGPGFGPGPWG
ncbi:PadR family transcriptional regulator, partial [Streptomyces sp. ID05-47C]|nr:PadR family transcriptional regulator [Streptomyces sp. ID05-47C]